MAQTITLTQSSGPLDLLPVWRSTPLVLTGAAVTGIFIYRAQLWRRPQDAREAGAVALATAYGSVTSGETRLAFTGLQMDVELAADNGAYDHLWLTLAAIQADGQPGVIRAGWLHVIEAGCDPAGFVLTGLAITITDDIASFEYPIGSGIINTFPVYNVPIVTGDAGWSASSTEDTITFTDPSGALSFATAVVPVS